MKILFIIRENDSCAYRRAFVPGKYLRMRGHEVSVMTKDIPDNSHQQAYTNLLQQQIDWADFLFICRGSEQHQLNLMSYAKARGKKVIADTDDDFLSLDQSNPGFSYFSSVRPYVEQVYRSADVAVLTTDFLAEKYKTYNSRTRVIPNYLDIDWSFQVRPGRLDRVFRPLDLPFQEIAKGFQDHVALNGHKKGRFDPYYLGHQRFRALLEGKKIIYWGGTSTHEHDLQQITPALVTLLKSRSDVVLVVGGCVPLTLISACPSDKLFLMDMVPIEEMYSAYKALGAHISVAPVAKTDFNKAKSHVRVTEAMLMRSYPLATNFDTYKDVIHKGILVEADSASWLRSLNVVLDKVDAKEIVPLLDENERYVRTCFDIREGVQKWENLLLDL